MQEYVDLQSGHMNYLISALDGDTPAASAASVALLPESADAELVSLAREFLRHASRPFELRKRWPSPHGMVNFGVKGLITSDLQGQPGRALSVEANSSIRSCLKVNIQVSNVGSLSSIRISVPKDLAICSKRDKKHSKSSWSRLFALLTCMGTIIGIVNLSEICGKPREPQDGKWRYSGVFFLGLRSNRARIGSS